MHARLHLSDHAKQILEIGKNDSWIFYGDTFYGVTCSVEINAGIWSYSHYRLATPTDDS